MSKPWTKPVTLALGEEGEDVTIDSTEAASWAMIEAHIMEYWCTFIMASISTLGPQA